VEVSRDELAVLAGAVGDVRGVARLAVESVMSGADLDVQVEREKRGYVVSVRVVRGDQLLREQEFVVKWYGLTEHARFVVLLLNVRGLCLGAERWKRRSDAAADAAIRAARARLGLPPVDDLSTIVK
jgi:hypothetical protein